jgi:hypothetical protein
MVASQVAGGIGDKSMKKTWIVVYGQKNNPDTWCISTPVPTSTKAEAMKDAKEAAEDETEGCSWFVFELIGGYQQARPAVESIKVVP